MLALLRAVREGMKPWGGLHFSAKYDAEAATARAEADAHAIMGRGFNQNFRVPTEPLVTLISQPGEGWFVSQKTIEAANVALWRMGQFNQIIQEQTDFLGNHLPEIYNPHTNEQVRKSMADTAKRLSEIIHGTIIGTDGWYDSLVDALDDNIRQLQFAADWSYEEWRNQGSRQGFVTEPDEETPPRRHPPSRRRPWRPASPRPRTSGRSGPS
jgi:hypothetical protein